MTDRRAALLTAAVLLAAFAVVVAVATPWDVLPEPPGGATPIDPTAGLPAEQVDRAEAFAAAIRPASLASLLLGLAVSAVLGLTRLGARLVRACPPPAAGAGPGRRCWVCSPSR